MSVVSQQTRSTLRFGRFSRRQVERLCLVLWCALIGVVIISINFSAERAILLTKGDFPGFYAPGVAVLRGEGGQLYDLDAQQRLQLEFWPNTERSFYISAYPASLAAVMTPLALLTPLHAKLLFSFVMCCFLWGAAVLIARECGWSPIVTATGMLLFPPMFISILGSQNTALSAFLFVTIRALIRSDEKAQLKIALPDGITGSEALSGRHVVAGLLLGIWCFKPQYALFFILLVLLGERNRWKRFSTLLGLVAAGGVHYILGVIAAGWSWPIDWVECALRFGSLNYDVNAYQMVSLVGVAAWFGQGSSVSFSTPALYLSLLLSVLLLLCLVTDFGGALRSHSQRKERSFADRLSLLGISLPILSPQTLFYDLGVSLPAFLLLTRHRIRSTIYFGLLFFLCEAVRVSLEWPLYGVLNIVLVLVFLLSMRMKRIEGEVG